MKTSALPLFSIGEVKLSYQKRQQSPFQKIASSSDADTCFRAIFPCEQINYREHMYVLYLNNSNEVLGYQLLSIGGITATIVDIRVLMQGALLLNAIAIILCHNHPSNKLKPSESDIQLTKKAAKSAEILDIKLLDHIIITEDNYYSFSDEGIL